MLSGVGVPGSQCSHTVSGRWPLPWGLGLRPFPAMRKEWGC